MDTYERLVAQTGADYSEHILGNPLMARLARGEVTHDLYAAYLGETYHLVRHTSRALALAAARLDDGRRDLRAWFLEQANEEHGHEQFCVRDLRALGLEPQQVVDNGPGAGAWGLVTQNYYMASYGNPVGILGVATATEGMGAELAGGLAQTLAQRIGIPQRALSFLRSHSGFDQRHLEQARRAVNAHVATASDYADVLWARRMTYRYYGCLFRDAVESNVRYFVEGGVAA